jgi:hypothetical protein
MGLYVSNIATPHRTLTERERRQLLKVTGERRDGYRDHVLYSMAAICPAQVDPESRMREASDP